MFGRMVRGYLRSAQVESTKLAFPVRHGRYALAQRHCDVGYHTRGGKSVNLLVGLLVNLLVSYQQQGGTALGNTEYGTLCFAKCAKLLQLFS
jgi:hypothetical protein